MKARKLNIVCVRSNHAELTETATAYIDVQLRKMCYQSLKTNFQKSGNKYLLHIMYTAAQSAMRSNNADYKEIVDVQYDGVELMHVVNHTYKLVNGVRIPIKPYQTIELTRAGKEYLQDTKENEFSESSITFEDLLQSAWASAMELNKLGLLADFDSIWQLKTVVYRSIKNAYYNHNKHNYYEAFSLDAENAPQTVDTKQIQDIENVETSVLFEQVRQAVFSLMDSRTRKEIAWQAWKMNKIEKYTQAEIARELGINQQAISRHVAKVNKLVQSVYSKFA